MTVFNLSPHASEIESLIKREEVNLVGIKQENLEEFALESHLEDFIINNWNSIKTFDDILAKKRNNKEFLVIELKKGKGSDEVVGQTLRY